MEKDLLIFVPGLSSRSPAKYKSRLVRNLETHASRRAGDFRLAGRDVTAASAVGAAGGPVVYEYTPGLENAASLLIEFREVVWGDIPLRLSELAAWPKCRQGFVLLFWGFACFLRNLRRVMANKYQWAAILGALLTVALWYASIIVALPSVLDVSLLPGQWSTAAKTLVGGAADWISGLSYGSLNLWVVVSFLLGIFPATALVDTVYAMKQYAEDSPMGNDGRFVGEEARDRIATVLKNIRREQGAASGPVFSRITILTHSFGTAPAIEVLAEFGADLKAPVQVITLGAPLSLIVILRSRLEKPLRELATIGRTSQGTRIDGWRCVWSEYDYIASDPQTVLSSAAAFWEKFEPLTIEGERGIWLFNSHNVYFSSNKVADIILDRDFVKPLPAQSNA